MAIGAHMVAGVSILSYKHTFPNISVFGISMTPPQAMLALWYMEMSKIGSW